MMIDEGYIKYQSEWEKGSANFPQDKLVQLNIVRQKLLHLNMIGKIPNGPGFGNISVLNNGNDFFITATDTGHIQQLKDEDVSLVYKTNITENRVWCKGLKNASSESMSHAVIYKELKTVKAVIHIHHKDMWNALKESCYCTDADIPYGTPEMASAIRMLIAKHANMNLLVLGGHEDGIIAFGSSLEEVFAIIEKEFQNIR